jgi:pimeloyl-ACP methyl ester carboxylesterase
VGTSWALAFNSLKSVSPKLFKIPVLAGLLSSCGQFGAPPESLIDEAMAPYASVEDAIELPDGRLLNFVCMGEGAPTVILTAGLGDFAGWAWSSVQADIAKTTRVCAWDRAGFGLSDGSLAPQTVATTTADLEAAIATGEIAGPYVMVGHSLGAYESLMFTDRHRNEVAGMVLIDPSFPGQFGADPAESQGSVQSDPEAARAAHLRKCAANIRNGALAPDTDDPDKCVAFPLVIPAVMTEALKEKTLGSPLQYETQASFNSNGAESSRLVLDPSRDYGAMPLIVLSALWEPRIPRFILDVISPELAPEHERIDRGHQALAALSTQGVRRMVSDAGHYIQKDQPQAVVDAVAAVVAEARAADK